MLTIRNSTFETNSSSTHSIAIEKKEINPEKLKGMHISFKPGEWGWNEDCETNTADYLYTAILGTSNLDSYKKKIGIIKNILDKYGATCDFPEVKEHVNDWGAFLVVVGCDWYGIDHARCCEEFVEAVLADEKLLLRFLFGDSCIYTGNDNTCEIDNPCFSAYDEIRDVETREYVKNPNHNADKYDYFFKSN